MIEAKTELFSRLQKWRIENGRDPETGRKRPRRPLDATRLAIIALRMAAKNGRADLRSEYEYLANWLEHEQRDKANP